MDAKEVEATLDLHYKRIRNAISWTTWKTPILGLEIELFYNTNSLNPFLFVYGAYYEDIMIITTKRLFIKLF